MSGPQVAVAARASAEGTPPPADAARGIIHRFGAPIARRLV
jgi:hypothetical protein